MKLDSNTLKYLEDMKLKLGETSDRYLKLKDKVLQNEATEIIKASKRNNLKIKSYPMYRKFQILKHSRQDKDTLNYIFEIHKNLGSKVISNITIKDLILRFNNLELQNNQDKITYFLKKKSKLQKLTKTSYKNKFKFALNNISLEIKTLNKGVLELNRYRKMLEEIIKHSIKVRSQITKLTPLFTQEEDIKIQNTETLMFHNKEFEKITFYSTGSIEIVRMML